MDSNTLGGRKRAPSNHAVEDQALDRIAKQAECRLAARRQARAEAREIRMREIERQQREAEENADKMFDMHNAVEAANRVRSNACLNNRNASMLNSPVGNNSRRSSEDSLEDSFNYRDVKVQIFKDSVKMQGETLILKDFPKKIVQLNEMIQQADWTEENLAHLHEDINIPVPEPIAANNCSAPASKKRKCDIEVDMNPSEGTKVFFFAAGMATSNKKLAILINSLKPVIKQLVEDSNILKMWISFMIPKIEDGNNFGVSIQEDTLAEIQTVETEAAAFFDQISRYYVTRAKLVSKVAKYPHIEDYRKAVNELDEKQYLGLWLALHEIRNHYSSLHDLVTKNLEKLKKPRNSNTESLY